MAGKKKITGAKRRNVESVPVKKADAEPAPMPLRLEWIDAQQLQENPANWRTHPDKQLSALKDVIAEVGWAGALLLNERTGRLIDGHARKKVAEGPVPVLVGSWTEDQERTILATLDPLAAMAEADHEALARLLGSVKSESAAVQAMLDDLAAEMPKPAPEVVEDEIPEDVEPVCKPGELWLLGEHRLLCGDSTKAEDVARVMNGARAGLCFTSPPYAQQRDYTAEAKEGLQDWYALMCGVFGNVPMADDGQILVNLGLVHRDGEWQPYWDGWIEWMRGQGWRRFGWYVWDQGFGLPGDWSGRLAPSHEFVFHFNREAVRPQKTERTNDRKDSKTVGFNKQGGSKQLTSPGAVGQPFKITDSVIRVYREMARGAQSAHPAVFSVGFAAAILKCWPGLCYEPFTGSGTTIIAAEQLSRRCYGIEISPRYCDVVIARWKKLTGQKATRA